MSGTATRYGRVIGLVAAGALALVSTTSAQAAPAAPAAPSACTITGYSPNKVVLGSKPVAATFKVSATGCTLASWAVGFEAFPNTVASIAKKRVTFSPKGLTNASAGRKEAVVLAIGAEDNLASDLAELDTTFTLLR